MNQNETNHGSHPTAGNRRLEPLSTQELTALLDEASHSPIARDIHDVITIMVNTGLRIGDFDGFVGATWTLTTAA
jgi:hypothetical protein